MIASFILLIVFIFLTKYLRDRKSSKFPPGPRSLPFIGHLHLWREKPHKMLTHLGQKYGRIFSLKFGSFNVIVLNDFKAIRDAFTMSAFDGRPTFKSNQNKKETKLYGILINHGPSWNEQRHFAVKTFGKFGVGKSSIEHIMNHEIIELIEELKKDAGNPINIQNSKLHTAVFNILWTIMTGKRYTHDDQTLLELHKELMLCLQKSRTRIIRFIPWLYLIWGKLKLVFKNAQEKQNLGGKLTGFIKTEIEEHLRTFRIEEDPQNFIDCYLAEMKKTDDQTSSFFAENGLKHLENSIRDMFIAAMDTTSTTLAWEFLLLTMFPDKQAKLREEIHRVVGLSRLPSLSDRPSMPFTVAVIKEVQRVACILPLGFFHQAMEDTRFWDYTIPKGTLICSNLYAAMHDPEIWKDPETFQPERFLSSDEKSLLKSEAFMPYSTGRRICIGMSLSEDELFLFTASLFQRFRMEPISNNVGLSLESIGTRFLMPMAQDILLQDELQE